MAFTVSSIALKTPQMLSEFMVTAGQSGGVQGKINTVTRIVTMVKTGISKGK